MISLQVDILMLNPTDFDLPKRVYYLALIFAISGRFIENKSRFLNNFTFITYQVKFIYSLRASSYTF